MMWLVPLLLAVLLASGLGLAYVVGGAATISPRAPLSPPRAR